MFSSSLPLHRFGFALVALLVEGLTLSLTVDFQPLVAAGGDSSWVGYSGLLLSWAIMVLVAAGLLIPGAAFERLEGASHSLRWLVIHVLAYLACFASALVAESSPGLVPALGFVGAGVVTTVAALAAAIRPDSLAQIMARHWRRFVAAIGIGTLALWVGLSAKSLWVGLSEVTLMGAFRLLRIVTRDVVVDPETALLGAGDFMVEVSAECSGFEGLGLTAVLVTGYLIAFRRDHRPRAWWALPIALCAVFAANVIRIAALVYIGQHLSADIAIGGFHSKAGWLLFSVVALSTLAVLRRSTEPDADAAGPNWTLLHLLPILVTTAAGLLGGLFEADFPLSYPVVAVAGGIALAYVLPRTSYLADPPVWAIPIGVGLVTYVVWILVQPAEDPAAVASRVGDLEALPTWFRWLWLGARIVGSVVIAPLAEELAFRGYLLRRIADRDFERVDPRTLGWLPVLLSCLAFGLMHGSIVGAILAGLAYTWVYRRRACLLDAVLAHAVTNAAIALEVLGLGTWSLWL